MMAMRSRQSLTATAYFLLPSAIFVELDVVLLGDVVELLDLRLLDVVLADQVVLIEDREVVPRTRIFLIQLHGLAVPLLGLLELLETALGHAHRDVAPRGRA